GAGKVFRSETRRGFESGATIHPRRGLVKQMHRYSAGTVTTWCQLPGSPSDPTPHHVRGDRKRPRQGHRKQCSRHTCRYGAPLVIDSPPKRRRVLVTARQGSFPHTRRRRGKIARGKEGTNPGGGASRRRSAKPSPRPAKPPASPL